MIEWKRRGADAPISWLQLPLRGAWTAWRSPADAVPSHGRDAYGYRFAYDFVRLDEQARPFRSPAWRAALGGLPVEDFLAWEQPVLAPLDADVVAVGESWPDRLRVHLPWAVWRERWLSPRLRGPDWRPLAGNHVLLRCAAGYLLCAHLRQGSVTVSVGQSVQRGEPLGRVGNSGHSAMPHLHLQLMDGPDLLSARGRLCGFRDYERLSAGRWLPVRAGLPERLQLVRSLAAA